MYRHSYLASMIAATLGTGYSIPPTLQQQLGQHRPSRSARTKWNTTTYFPPSRRNGAQECARRLAQGLGGLNRA